MIRNFAIFFAGFALALACCMFLIWAGDAWRYHMAIMNARGLLYQGLNTIWYGAGPV